MNSETNRFKRAWIWFWYNDITRVFILVGFPIAPSLWLAYHLGIRDGEVLYRIAIFTYIFFVGWGILDNDYSNLRRIGLDEYRNDLI